MPKKPAVSVPVVSEITIECKKKMEKSQIEPGYISADSENLPRLSASKIAGFIYSKGQLHILAVKTIGQENYDAVGFVQLKRKKNICTIQGKVYSKENQLSNVTLLVNEEEHLIEDIQCSICSPNGECHHTLMFLEWFGHKSEEISFEDEVEDYWVQPKLITGVDEKNESPANSRNKEPSSFQHPEHLTKVKNSSILDDFIKLSKENNVSSLLYDLVVPEPMNQNKKLSIHYILWEYFQNQNGSPEEFIEFVSKEMSDALCDSVYKETQKDKLSEMWDELSYGRIPTSKLLKATKFHPHTIESILGAYCGLVSKSKLRSKKLAPLIKKELSIKFQKVVKSCGLHLRSQYPIFCSSAFGCSYETDDFIIVVKCPSSDGDIQKYIQGSTVMPKVKHQLMLEMLLSGKTKGLLCVVSPNFKKDKALYFQWVDYEEEELKRALSLATTMWKENVFTKLKV